MNRTEELIRKNRSAVERIAKEAKKRIGENPWFAYEWGKERIDSSVGYEPNNVVSCCKICNHAKSNLTKDDFINWAIRVAEHSKAMAEQWAGKCES